MPQRSAAFMLLALALSGCDLIPGFGEDAPPSAPSAAPAAPQDVGAKLVVARKMLGEGKLEEAARAAEAIVGAHPDSDAAWDLLEIAVTRARGEAALVDRLAADTAIGGRTDRHHVLRGTAAVRAGRLGDALASARALVATAPGDAAVILLGAVAAGAPAPTDLPGPVLSLLATRDGAALSAEALALPGWRAAAARAEVLLARGDRAAAAAEASRIEGTSGPAAIAGASLRARTAADAAAAVGAAEPVARAVAAEGDAVGAAMVLDAALPVAASGWKADVLAGVAGELGATAGSAGDAPGAAALAAAEADAALRAGLVARASKAASSAMGHASTKARGAWAAALAGVLTGDAALIDTAAAALAEPKASAARGLASVVRGSATTVPLAGLQGADAALAALAASTWTGSVAPEALAVLADPVTDAADLAAWARWSVRGPVALDASAPASAIAENAVRRGEVSALPDGVQHPEIAGWVGLRNGQVAQGTGVTAWTRARAAISSGDQAGAAREYANLALSVPGWRTGPWSPLLALDGPRAADVANEIPSGDSSDGGVVSLALMLHGWHHREAASRLGWTRGIAPFPGSATVEQRLAVWEAVARARVVQVQWLTTGQGDLAAARTALVAAEQAAGLRAFVSPTLEPLRAGLDGAALLSWRALPDGGAELLAVSSTGARVLRQSAGTIGAVAGWTDGLRAGTPDVRAGDAARTVTVDAVKDVLTGIGRYVVVADGPMRMLPIGAMPEQADGLRFLASIRHVGYLYDLDAVVAPPPSADTAFGVTMLALCTTEEEASALRLVYPDAVTLVGPQATLAAWRQSAPQARYVHLGRLPRTEDGGYALADGTLSLAEIASSASIALAASVAGAADRDVQALAFRRAGVRDVLVTGGPDAEDEFSIRLLQRWWENVNRRESGGRALSDSRNAAVRDAGGTAGREPQRWGLYLVAGKP